MFLTFFQRMVVLQVGRGTKSTINRLTKTALRSHEAAARVHGIVYYLLLSFGLTWAVEFAMIARGIRFEKPAPWTFRVLITMFPALAAFVTRRWITREGFSDAGLRFGSWRPYVAVFVAVPSVFVAVHLLSWLLGLARLELAPGMRLGLDPVLSTTMGPILISPLAFGEEFGWTGYLLPRLLPLGKWRAAFIYGFIWGLWHAPLVATGYNFPGYPVAGVLLMCVGTVVIGFHQTFLRLRYGSVLLTSWLHACINSQGIWRGFFVVTNPLLGGFLGVVGLVLIGLIGAYLLAPSPEKEMQA